MAKLEVPEIHRSVEIYGREASQVSLCKQTLSLALKILSSEAHSRLASQEIHRNLRKSKVYDRFHKSSTMDLSSASLIPPLPNVLFPSHY